MGPAFFVYVAACPHQGKVGKCEGPTSEKALEWRRRGLENQTGVRDWVMLASVECESRSFALVIEAALLEVLDDDRTVGEFILLPAVPRAIATLNRLAEDFELAHELDEDRRRRLQWERFSESTRQSMATYRRIAETRSIDARRERPL